MLASVIGQVIAQVIVDPTVSPEINRGGWVYSAAVLLAVAGVLAALLIVFGYMRFAPRFQTAEGTGQRVRAPRVQPGKDVRRPVNVTGAPIVAQPPVVAAVGIPAGGAGAAAPGSGSAAGSPQPAAPASEAASQSPSAATPAPAPAVAPAQAAAPAPAEAPAQAAAPAQAPAETPPAEAPAQAAAPAAAPTQHMEVSLDQETFDTTLAELLEKGTDRRVAEGQARRAAMIAARKKAGG
ncbi:MAG TPA: hypothetical protein VLA90_07165 [Actinomycetota bacterium]|nr:hypothetical protein [Actinomycetota bacterium]